MVYYIIIKIKIKIKLRMCNMTIYDFKAKTIKGTEKSISDYAGSVLLIVNTASGCGFTPQYEGLQKLYETYHSKGLEILGFPSNQFLEQEPGSDEEIQSFCSLNFGVTFPLFSKTDVRGETANPLFKFLIQQAPFEGFDTAYEMGRKIEDVVRKNYPQNLEGDDIKWNFTKFLVDREGNDISRYESYITPAELNLEIESLL
jgi:glutathione peroxidase